MMNQIVQVVKNKIREYTAAEIIIVRSPGRINFIGEHTDYNDGFVLPAAINKSVFLAAAKTDSDRIQLVSADMNDSAELKINSIGKTGKLWADYLAGTAAEFQKSGYNIGGFVCVFSGDIPIGAGLSSSAAITCGLAFALNELFALNISAKDLAFIAQKAEHNFAGVNCGIMDQFINLFAEKDKVLKLDCRSLEYNFYPFDFPDIDIILCDSGIRRSLAGSEYNTRRIQCDKGAAAIKEKYPLVKNLRDVDISMLEEFGNILPPDIYSRCLYVVEENERVRQAASFLDDKNISSFGELLAVTHEGLRIDYEVSIPEMDFLVYSALDFQGVIGSRMMGGGFGGCTINLVEKDRSENFIEKMHILYKDKTGSELRSYKCSLESGTSLIK